MNDQSGDTKKTRAVEGSSIVSASQLHPSTVVTLLSDFGRADYFVGAMKGVILDINPHTKVVDITHEIPPYDIETGAFIVMAAYQSFPAGTTHVAVVDPGVGSARLPIIVATASHQFIGPDNGIFSYIYDSEPEHQVFEIIDERYFRHPVSSTFHGRDIFAPVAAAISRGVKPETLGRPLDDYIRLESLAPTKLQDGNLRGRIIHVDHFGNCITNFTERHVVVEDGVDIYIKGKTIKSFKRFFSETGKDDELFGIFGSAGFLEISAQNVSAARLLDVRRGEDVILAYRSATLTEN